MNNITAVILAGGQGRRMGGQDKGLLDIHGQPLVAGLLQQLQSQVPNIVINANRNQAQYQRFDYPVISDELSDYQGPLAGFATAMQVCDKDYILTLPCDAPHISAEYSQRMWDSLQQNQADISVAHDGERLQPVHALIAVKLLPSLQQFLAQGERKIDLWYAKHKMASVNFSDQAWMFKNINTPQHYSHILEEMRHD